MGQSLSDYRLFLREFRRNHHTTGAILPSGRYLATALARHVGIGPQNQRVLEVGPGTGAVTRHVVPRLRPEDSLDLVELNPSFAESLRVALAGDPVLRAAADRSRVFEMAVEQLPTDVRYDVIISSLPLNGFPVETVRSILDTFRLLLAPGGTLSFFGYMAMRPIQAIVSGRDQRRRLRDVGRTLDEFLEQNEIRRDWIWLNVPPAWVHHVRLS